MCSIILNITQTGIFIAANRDEILQRPWRPPAAHWPDDPEIIGGLDETAGGTWLAINAQGVMAAVLNRHGTLGPALGKRSRGELPLLALKASTAAAAAANIAALDAGHYRSFNVVIADAKAAFLLRGLESGGPEISQLAPGVTMLTAGEPNDMAEPRIARHLPKFRATGWEDWPALLADNAPPWDSALNIAPRNGFGTVCASVIELPKSGGWFWRFSPGAPDQTAFDWALIPDFPRLRASGVLTGRLAVKKSC